jgi:hypothetical protein
VTEPVNEPHPREPYSPPELEELGTVDQETQAIVGSFAGTGPDASERHTPR